MTIEQPAIRPRSDWGADLPALGPLQAEDDVRFLLVHHTASPNVGPDAAVSQLRSFYGYHTSAEKGWPDIAYNFLIDSGGQIWEGRTGSLAGPVRGDATGGSQGHALLCCFIGTFADVPPSEAATGAMTHLLAWLAQTYAVSLAEGATVTFTSRGSNRWPAGTTVTTPTISGHRDMSQTSCPGDMAYAMLETTFRPGARALLPEAVAPTPDTPITPEPTATPEASPSETASAAASPTPSAPPSASPSPTGSPRVSAQSATSPEASTWPAVVGGLVGTGALAALGWVLNRRMRGGPGPRHEGG